MTKDFIEVETTMSELLLQFFNTKEGKDYFKKLVYDDWECELDNLLDRLQYHINKSKENKIIIKIRRCK